MLDLTDVLDRRKSIKASKWEQNTPSKLTPGWLVLVQFLLGNFYFDFQILAFDGTAFCGGVVVHERFRNNLMN